MDCALVWGKGVCLRRMCVHFRVYSLCSPLTVCVCSECAGMWPPSRCLSNHRERLGEGCVCVCVCVCVFYVPSSPNAGAKGPGLPLFFQGLGGSRTGGEGL